MNQGKLEVVKQEMARVNVDILGISELKWTGMGEFNSDDHYIYYCGQESLRRNGVAIIVNKRVRNAVLGCNLKNDRIISVRFQGKPFNITGIQVYTLTSNAEEAEVEQLYEGLKLNIQKNEIMASGPITSWQIDGETVDTVTDFILRGSKITANGDCNHEIESQPYPIR